MPLYRSLAVVASVQLAGAATIPAQADLKAAQEPASTKPNLAFMLIDDLGWSDTEFGGSGTADRGFVRTPVFKSLKSESIQLGRHYAYAWCGPSRSSLLSGRLPVHVNVNHSNPVAFIENDPVSSGEGIPAGMGTIGTKLQSAGYKTHYTGKWGVGFTWKEQNPMSRGFDSFFGFLHDSIDFWDEKLGNQSIEVAGGCEKAMRALDPPNYDMAVDLILNDGPATGKNGTDWVDYQFLDHSLEIIKNHDVALPLFLLHSFHSIHAPLNAPAELYTGNYAPPPCTGGPDAMRECFLQFGSLDAADDEFKAGADRRSYSAMVTWVDKAVGEIIEGFKNKNMWDNTLMVVSSDNGGPQYMSPRGYQLWGSGNNLPLRGGKTSEFEGGVRVNSFVTGGLIPTAMRGKSLDNMMHFADWYATWSHLAGVDAHDEMAEKNGLPAVDSINQWPLLSGEVTDSLRTEMQISPATYFDGKWKLMTGADPGSINEHTKAGYVPFDKYATGYYNAWSTNYSFQGGLYASYDSLCSMIEGTFNGYDVPGVYEAGQQGEILKFLNNATPAVGNLITATFALPGDHCRMGLDCRNGCLFDIESDPNETTDVGSKYPKILKKMKAAHKKLSKPWTKEEPWGVFNPIRNGEDPRMKGTAEECQGDGCTNLDTCYKMVYETGFWSWVAVSKK